MVYPVKRFTSASPITVSVPASKSILSRAILLAAFTEGDTVLHADDFGEDTRALLGCVGALGILYERRGRELIIHGGHPESHVCLDIMSAGTAARFLTAILSFAGGEYELHASAQMQARPMEILPVLEACGVSFEFLGERYRFPFRIHSRGISLREISVDTSVSTQYASGILLAGGLGREPLTLRLTGTRTDGSYLRMTLSVLERFGSSVARSGNVVSVTPAKGVPYYSVEPDLSSACYFYALALLLRRRVVVRGVRPDTLQGDRRFLGLLAEKGVILSDEEEGLAADGTAVSSYGGFDVDLQDFSDQTLTVAALAAFATSPSVLRGVKHIRTQECDRIHAVVENLNALGVPCRTDGDSIEIRPSPVHGGTVKTYGDHRVAMAFSLIGCKVDGVAIDDPTCCRKTFDRFFEVLESLA